MKLKKILKKASKEALKSRFHVKIGAVLFDNRGRIVASGYNHEGNLGKALGKYSVHAEMDALQKVVKPSPNLNILIYRNGNKPIDPCECCEKLLEVYQIRKIYARQ